MSRWVELTTEIAKGRASTPDPVGSTCAAEIRGRLVELSRKGRCSETVQGWLHDNRKLGQVAFSSNADGRDGRNHPALVVWDAQQVPAGVLSIQVTYNPQNQQFLKYTVALRMPATGPPTWFARIDLDYEPMGRGLCSHPLLHCHVGEDPESPALPEARVPLPWLTPWNALEWILATWDDSLDPEPLNEKGA